MKKYLISFLLIIAAIISFRLILNVDHPKESLALSKFPLGGDFSFKKNGKVISLSDFRQKVVFIYFGYTYCPDICPTTLAALSKVYKDLSSEQQKKTQILFITVDPERDTYKKLDNYVNFFKAKIISLRGQLEETKKIAKKYGVYFEKHYPSKGHSNYVVDHGTSSFLVGKDGKVSHKISHGESIDKIKELLVKELEK
ncbi:MAG: SCO family protein [Bacteriovoracaceae bacterium]|jgi:protein SCO1/2|nr:SCO family protein [Bacteriovoracaceae bacterium]